MRLLPVLLVLWLTACAAPNVGVRTEFGQSKVNTIMVAPFYSRASFGYAPSEVDAIVKMYQDTVVVALRARGFKVIAPDELRARMEEQGTWETFEQGVLLKRALQRTFEPTREGLGSELRTIRTLAHEQRLPQGVFLFGEVLYHSASMCRERADQATQFARVIFDPGLDMDRPHPCVTAHMQAKLVDPFSGSTMWYNRLLHERHVKTLTPGMLGHNVILLVKHLLEGPRGLQTLQRFAHKETRPSG